MTKAELLLAGRLLQLAELLVGLHTHERGELEIAYNVWNSVHPDDYVPFQHIGDSSWMAYLAHKLLESSGRVKQ